MARMSRVEAYEIFEQSEKIKKIVGGNVGLIDDAIRNPDASSLSFHLGIVDSMESLVVQNLNELVDASENAGWWSKKIAVSYYSEIRQLFLHYKSGINVLAHLVSPEMVGSVFEQRGGSN